MTGPYLYKIPPAPKIPAGTETEFFLSLVLQLCILIVMMVLPFLVLFWPSKKWKRRGKAEQERIEKTLPQVWKSSGQRGDREQCWALINRIGDME